MDEPTFDQDLSHGGGGWRALAARPGCERVTADLIRDWREQHGSTAMILIWHEAQMRASANDNAAAIALMRQAYRPQASDRRGWNLYVDATIAFLQHDKPALLAARERLSAVAPPADVTLDAQGFFDLPLEGGQVLRIRWPPNIEVVDGLIQCFDRSYDDAYGSACRLSGPSSR